MTPSVSTLNMTQRFKVLCVMATRLYLSMRRYASALKAS